MSKKTINSRDSTDLLLEGEGLDPHHHHGDGKFQLMKTGGVAASCFSFAAASMGAGTLGLPSAMESAGALWGALMLVLVCVLTVYSIRLLVIVVEDRGYMTYEQMAHGLLGRFFEKTTAFLIVAFCWGVTIAYVVAIADVMGKLSVATWFPESLSGPSGHKVLAIIYWGCFMLPLSLMKEINALRYSSTIGVCSTIYLVTTLLVHSVNNGWESAQKNLTIARFDIGMVVSLPIFSFSYCCQTNAFEIYTEMRPRTVNQMTKVATIAMIVCTSLYITAGVSGFANFGSATHGNVLNNLNPMDSVYIAIAFFAITVTLTCAFPLCILPTRDAVLQVMGYESAYHTPTAVRVVVCATLSYASLVIGLYVPGIKVLFAVLGGICGSTLAFLWPAIFYIKGVKGGFSVSNVGIGNVIGVVTLLFVGAVAAILGTAVSIIQEF